MYSAFVDYNFWLVTELIALSLIFPICVIAGIITIIVIIL